MSNTALASPEEQIDDIDWGGIRASAVVIGVREAARRAVPHLRGEEQIRFVNRVLKRSEREQWMPKGWKSPASAMRTAGRDVSSTVITGAEILSQHMTNCDNESKIGYATVSRKLATRFSEMEPDDLIACTPAVKDGVVIADKTFGWTRQAQEKQAALVQIAITGCPSVSIAPTE